MFGMFFEVQCILCCQLNIAAAAAAGECLWMTEAINAVWLWL